MFDDTNFPHDPTPRPFQPKSEFNLAKEVAELNRLRELGESAFVRFCVGVVKLMQHWDKFESDPATLRLDQKAWIKYAFKVSSVKIYKIYDSVQKLGKLGFSEHFCAERLDPAVLIFIRNLNVSDDVRKKCVKHVTQGTAVVSYTNAVRHIHIMLGTTPRRVAELKELKETRKLVRALVIERDMLAKQLGVKPTVEVPIWAKPQA